MHESGLNLLRFHDMLWIGAIFSPPGVAMPTGFDGVRQAGVVAAKDGLVCLVTSSSGKRWVIPKGCMEPGKTAGEIALQEAWEEAGLVGVLKPEPRGSFTYEKFGRAHHVIVFEMTVTEVATVWPESNLRQRSFLKPSVALTRIDDLGLREIIRGLFIDEHIQVG
jgi:8-oxo-dGTP pyrophosphatase MutT (NUDIX family)